MGGEGTHRRRTPPRESPPREARLRGVDPMHRCLGLHRALDHHHVLHDFHRRRQRVFAVNEIQKPLIERAQRVFIKRDRTIAPIDDPASEN